MNNFKLCRNILNRKINGFCNSFSSLEFSSSESSEEIYMLTLIYPGIFFPSTTSLHSPKNT